MYQVDARDRVVRLDDVPPIDVGAPCPIVLATEHLLTVGYYSLSTDPPAEGEESPEPIALVRFRRPEASFLGPPNDDAFRGHPLAARGLRPYEAFEVRDSSWLREMERRNSVHPNHDPQRYARLRHFVLAFHDSTFECVAQGYACEVGIGPLRERMVIEARLMDSP